MSDLIKRLEHRIVVDGIELPGPDDLHREAAQEIRSLTLERDKYKREAHTLTDERDTLSAEVSRLGKIIHKRNTLIRKKNSEIRYLRKWKWDTEQNTQATGRIEAAPGDREDECRGHNTDKPGAASVSGSPEPCQHKYGDSDGYYMDHCVYCGESNPDDGRESS